MVACASSDKPNTMTKSRNLVPARRFWTEAEDELLRQAYAKTKTADLAQALNRPVGPVHRRASELGLRKDRDLIGDMAREALLDPDHGGRAHFFKSGLTPWNKGTHFAAGGRSVETRFKPGRPACEARNYVPIGTLRLSKDGYLERKVTDDPSLVSVRRWKGVHRLVWEETHGPVLEGHAVAFKPGRKTADPALITLDALELVTRAELMLRNTVHRLPKELVELVQLRGALIKQINRKTKEVKETEAP